MEGHLLLLEHDRSGDKSRKNEGTQHRREWRGAQEHRWPLGTSRSHVHCSSGGSTRVQQSRRQPRRPLVADARPCPFIYPLLEYACLPPSSISLFLAKPREIWPTWASAQLISSFPRRLSDPNLRGTRVRGSPPNRNYDFGLPLPVSSLLPSSSPRASERVSLWGNAVA